MYDLQKTTTNVCYLITNYYDQDGNFIGSTEELIDSYCLPCCVAGPDGNSTPCTEIGNDDGSGSGGSGPASVEYEYATNLDVIWLAYISNDGFNKLNVMTELKGTTAPNNGNKFIDIKDRELKMGNQFVPENSTYATWTLYTDGYKSSVSSDKKTGSTIVKGKIRWLNNSARPAHEVDETKQWNADNDLH